MPLQLDRIMKQANNNNKPMPKPKYPIRRAHTHTSETTTFVANKSYGNCCICKRELLRGTVIRQVKLSNYTTNVRGYAHAHGAECHKLNKPQVETV